MGENVREVFYKQLLKYSKKRGKSQTDISNDLGISLTTVSGWFRGVNFPRPDKMQKLADYLGINMETLITEDKEGFPTHFESAANAIEFILRVPVVANNCGYNLDTMSDEEIIEMAEELSDMLKIMSKRHTKR